MAQTLVVALCLLSLSVDDRVFPSIPIILERFLLGLAWVWFINLLQFHGRHDGLAGSEASRCRARLMWRCSTLCRHRGPLLASGARDRGGDRRLSILELASGARLHGRLGLDPAGVPAGLADARLALAGLWPQV